MPKRIAVLVTHDFEDSEYTEPVEAFRAARHCISNIEHQAGNVVYGKRRKSSVTIDQSIDHVSIHDFDALLIPGGYSPDRLRADDRYVEFVRDFAGAQKPIMCICHGPQLLISADVIRGRKLTAVKPIVIDVKNAGAEFYDQEVVVDKDQLVTSRTPDDLPAFNREALRLLGA